MDGILNENELPERGDNACNTNLIPNDVIDRDGEFLNIEK